VSGILGSLTSNAKWAAAWVLTWGALLSIASFPQAAGLAAGLAWLIALSAFLTQGVKALQQLGVI